MLKGTISFLLLLTSSYVQADPSYGGDGCPVGTARMLFDAQGNLHVHLNSFGVQAGQNGMPRKSCNLAIPLTVPAGHSANFGHITFLGDHSLVNNASAILEAEAFSAGTTGPRYDKQLNGQSGGAFNFSFMPNGTWSKCGQSIILRLNSSLFLKTNQSNLGNSSVGIYEIVVEKPIFKACS